MREAFIDNFVYQKELGGACCAYVQREKVVDLWAGIRNKETGEPWEKGTMVIVFSATKGLAAMTLALAQHQAPLGYKIVWDQPRRRQADPSVWRCKRPSTDFECLLTREYFHFNGGKFDY